MTQETSGAKLYSEVWPDALLNFENVYARISVAVPRARWVPHPTKFIPKQCSIQWASERY